jgi:predicted chitinase
MKQLTGRNNYKVFTENYAKYWSDEADFVEKPELVGIFPFTLRSAVYFWVENDCWRDADRGMNDEAIDSVTKIVNPGEITNHKKGAYKPHEDPVLQRRKFVKLAYAAFT